MDQTKSSSKKIPLIILFILLISGISSFATYQLVNKNDSSKHAVTIQVTPTMIHGKDEIEEWKTYTNKKIGFQIQYPQIYTTFAAPGVQGVSFNEEYGYIGFGKQFNQEVYRLFFAPYDGTLETLLQERKKSYDSSAPKHIIPPISSDIPKDLVKKFEVDGYKANWYKTKLAEKTINEVHFIAKGYAFIYKNEYIQFDEKEFNKILSTFKFIEKTSNIDSSSSVNNTQKLGLYDLTFNLPPNWKLEEVNRRPEPKGPPNPEKGHDCAEYKITSSDKKVMLMLKPICGFADDGPAIPLRSNPVTIKELGKNTAVMRIKEKDTSFQYVTVYKDTKTNGVPELHYSTWLNYSNETKHINLFADLTLDPGTPNEEEYVSVVDSIMKSLK